MLSSDASRTPRPAGASSMASQPTDSMESAVKQVESALQADSAYPLLVDLFAACGPIPSCSGLQDHDYPADPLGAAAPANATATRRTPLPTVLADQVKNAHLLVRQGLFPEIGRAWLTVDSDLFVWRFETGDDVAYFDGLSEAILAVGLVRLQPAVFQAHIHSLLCLATCTEIVLLGATFQGNAGGEEELFLLPEPLFTVSADNVPMTCVAGTASGRIFLGGGDGCLHEIVYSTTSSWFGSRCRKVNHSKSIFSYLVPAIVSLPFAEEDPIVQVVVDDSRHVLYTRSERGALQVFDLGPQGDQASRVIAVSLASLTQMAARVVPTVDADNFRVLVHIEAVPLCESLQTHLVAITQAGVRLYLSTCSYSSPDARPSTLALLHVRLPPGFSAHVPPQRVRAVRTALCRRGTTVLVAAHTDDRDWLWTLAADAYPFRPRLMEAATLGQLDAGVGSVAEIPSHSRAPQPCCTIALSGGGSVPSNPPLVVTQHMEGPQRFVFLSLTSCCVYEKPRPVDMLRRLLEDPGATRETVVRAFFELHGEVQASATCLILACNRGNVRLADLATQALLRYGGEAKMVNPEPAQSIFGAASPVWASTPLPGIQGPGRPLSNLGSPLGLQQQQQPYGWRPTGLQASAASPPAVPQSAGVTFSGRHDGCYLYFSRLVRPLWALNLLSPVTDPKTGKLTDVLTSTIPSGDLENYLCSLVAFKQFLERSSMLVGSPLAADSVSSFANVKTLSRSRLEPDTPAHLQEQMLRKTQAEAASQERASLARLLRLVSHTSEVLGLWKVLCDHQFRFVSAALPPDVRDQLRNTTLRELLLASQQLPAALAAALVQTYLEDNAATEQVSNRLRQVCPSLYRSEDALFTRANEKLLAARAERNTAERRKLLDEAVALCKQVGPPLPLGVACALLVGCGHHVGVVDLCLSLAKQEDPRGLAVHYYQHGERPEDVQGRQAYTSRMECYQVILEMLNELRSTPPSGGEPSSSREDGSYESVLSLALQSDDEMFHVALYGWLCKSGQSTRLLAVCSAFLEKYLQRRCRAPPDADLLWKYHQRTGNYSAAAHILARLADWPGADVPLDLRIEYLERAILSVKSPDFQVTNAAREGDFLHQLQEKLDVARLQVKVRNALLQRPELAMASELAARLDTELVDVTRLYGEFADPCDLAECKLAIVRSSEYDKPLLIESLWRGLLEREFHHEHLRADELVQRLASLAREYAPSEKFFPLPFLVKFLELRGNQHGFAPGWIIEPLLDARVSVSKLRDAYNDLYRSKDPAWSGRSLHLLQAVARLIGLLVRENLRQVEGGSANQRHLANRCLADIPGYLVDLQSMPAGNLEVDDLERQFKEFQVKLSQYVSA